MFYPNLPQELFKKGIVSMIDKQKLRLHFSKNASNYDENAHVQKKMSHTLINSIKKNNNLSNIKNILEIGCGTGELTLSLSKLFPSSHITAVDIAPGMIDTAKSKFKNQYIDFICDDIENMKIKHNYDLIISNAAFQWFNNLQKTVDKLYVALNSAGILCFSTFGQYTFCELKECFNKAGKMLSLKDPISPGQVFYNLDDLTLLCNNIVNNRLHGCKSLVESKEIFEYEYFNNCRDFLYSVKKIGASSSNKQTGPASPAFIRKVISLYNENYMKNNRVKATYHCLFFKITK